VLDSTNAFELIITDAAGLAGLPPSAVAAARESAARKGREGWRFTLHAPDYFAVMTYLDDAAVRRQVYEAFSVRATEAGSTTAAHRAHSGAAQREARLLGYANFADLVLEDRMAHDGARALAFLDDLKVKTEARFREENRELLEFRRSLEGPAAAELAAGMWPTTRKSNAPRCTISTKKLCGRISRWNRRWQVCSTGAPPVRPAHRARAGAPVWDEAVRYYNVHDESGEFLAASMPTGSRAKTSAAAPGWMR